MIDTVHGNRLIAKFMGGEFKEDLPYTWTKTGWIDTPANDNKTIAQDYDFKYHVSWDWLMEVVDKLESTGQTLFFGEMKSEGVYEKILKFHNMPRYGFGSKKFSDTKIQAAYQAVVELIIAINRDKEENEINS